MKCSGIPANSGALALAVEYCWRWRACGWWYACLASIYFDFITQPVLGIHAARACHIMPDFVIMLEQCDNKYYRWCVAKQFRAARMVSTPLPSATYAEAPWKFVKFCVIMRKFRGKAKLDRSRRNNRWYLIYAIWRKPSLSRIWKRPFLFRIMSLSSLHELFYTHSSHHQSLMISRAFEHYTWRTLAVSMENYMRFNCSILTSIASIWCGTLSFYVMNVAVSCLSCRYPVFMPFDSQDVIWNSL